MQAQRLRNLTTGILHTDMDYVYEDLVTITGEKGLMIHMLPRALRSIMPWLRKHVTEPRFWDGEYDLGHVGEYTLPEPTQDERDIMKENYMSQAIPSLFTNSGED